MRIAVRNVACIAAPGMRMRALVLTGPRACDLVEVGVPWPTTDQVLIRVEGCGVCASNLPQWDGRPWFAYPAPPGNPGHEGWGRVIACGSAVGRRIAIGDRVVFLSDRAFAEYAIAPASSTVVLPPELAGHDVPGESLGCAVNVFRRSAIGPGHTVAIIGFGFLGAIITQLAVHAGARVIAISQRAFSRTIAQRLGACAALELASPDAAIVSAVEDLTRGQLCDRVIELVGLERPLALAAQLTRVRGRLTIAGIHHDGPRSIDMFMWNWRGIDVINAHERAPAVTVGGMTAAIDRVVSGVFDPAPLYTHRFPLERAAEAFELLRLRPDGFVKALVTS
jgi:threonine dehydrogenase-like Zn-dependent dehydrogenase